MSAPPPPLPQQAQRHLHHSLLSFPLPHSAFSTFPLLPPSPPLPPLPDQKLPFSLSLPLSRDSCVLEKGGGKRKAKQDGGGRGNEGPGRHRKRGGREGGGKGPPTRLTCTAGSGKDVSLHWFWSARPRQAVVVGLPPPLFQQRRGQGHHHSKSERGGRGRAAPGEPESPRAAARRGLLLLLSQSSVRPSVFGSGIEAAKGGGEERRGPQLERRASSGRETPFSSACQHPHLKEGRRERLCWTFPPFPLAYTKTVQKHRL